MVRGDSSTAARRAPIRAPATARLAAHDVMRYDQQGCYSPHVFYVERGGKVAPPVNIDALPAYVPVETFDVRVEDDMIKLEVE